MLQSVSILGCGWLGLPLGEFLLEQGYLVKGSTTQTAKLPLLAAAGVHPFLVSLEPHPGAAHPGELAQLLQADVLLIALPPQVEKRGESFHPGQIRSLGEVLKTAPVRKVIYISSTSVYPEANREVTETEPLRGHNAVSRAILGAEEMVATWEQDWVILRCGGLMGYNRIPGKYATGRKGVTTGDVPVNFVHRDDVMRIIHEVIRQPVHHQIYNVVAPQHPKRREIYAQNARDFGYDPPEYTESAAPDYKIVSSQKLMSALQYPFRFPDPLTFPYTP